MLVKVFTDRDARAQGPVGLLAILPVDEALPLPRHPRDQPWRYYATMSSDDALLAARRDEIKAMAGRHGAIVVRQFI